MRKPFQFIVFALVLAMTFGFAGCGNKNPNGDIASGDLALDENFKCTITVDGGGQWANFNTTTSMVESESNPYPYNTLETLAKEYISSPRTRNRRSTPSPRVRRS